jgi:transcriptional regulator with XRE-family HTH domain
MGQLVRDARLKKGWRQIDLAKKLGVDDAYLSQIETGARRWPQELVRPLADALGLSQVDMAVAAGLIDPPETQSGVSEAPATYSADDPLNDLFDRIRAMSWNPDAIDTVRSQVRLLERGLEFRNQQTELRAKREET